jgi:prepilin-type processing-associated H-X9-DG protein
MNTEAILRLVFLFTAVAASLVGLAAFSNFGKKRAWNVALAFVIAWTVLTLGGGIYLKPKVGPILVVEGVLLAAALILAFVGGTLGGKLKAAGASPTIIAAVFAGLVLLDLRAFYQLNAAVVALAGEIGVDKTQTKYVPNANKDCPENLKSLYFAFSQYADGNGALPPADKWMENDEIASKIQKEEWLHCPQVSNRHDTVYGYAYNDAIAGKQLNGKKLNEMPNAASTPLLYDSSNLTKSAHDAFTSLPKPGRHGGKNNVLYCDGHVVAQ